jgi:hypothetical protein
VNLGTGAGYFPNGQKCCHLATAIAARTMTARTEAMVRRLRAASST